MTLDEIASIVPLQYLFTCSRIILVTSLQVSFVDLNKDQEPGILDAAARGCSVKGVRDRQTDGQTLAQRCDTASKNTKKEKKQEKEYACKAKGEGSCENKHENKLDWETKA